MFYDPRLGDHGLPHDPFKAIVAPRPIGWISSLDAQGRANLAPYSFFNAVSTRPHIVMFASSGRKDSVRNIEATGEFVCNLASWDLRLEMNETSASLPYGRSEFEVAQLASASCRIVRVPRVARAAAALECKLLKAEEISDLEGRLSGTTIVLGEVVGIHVEDRCLHDGRFDMTLAQTIARCGYMDYAAVDRLFEMRRPGG